MMIMINSTTNTEIF